MARQPFVAGQFYEKEFDLLNKEIEACFYSKFGPGDLPVKRSGTKTLKAVISPHAGYSFSGACAAWAYKEIAESRFPRTFIIIGPSHYGLESGMSSQEWNTPFGVVKPDSDLIKTIQEETTLRLNELIHKEEHSIEVQLPFLQFVNKDRIADIRIVPIALGRDFEYKDLAAELNKAIIKSRRDVVLIISSDFTHFGRNYHYVPFTTDIPNKIMELDKGAVKLIMDFDSDGFRDYLNKTGITICGYMPILVFMEMMKLNETKPKAELLIHYTSGDVMEDYKNSVSYVSMVFR